MQSHIWKRAFSAVARRRGLSTARDKSAILGAAIPSLQFQGNLHWRIYQQHAIRSFSSTPVLHASTADDGTSASAQTVVVTEGTGPLEADSASSAGLVESVADLLTNAHSFISMDGRLFGWGVTLFATGIVVRSLSMPLVYFAQLQRARATLVTKEMQRIQAYLRGAPGSLAQKYLTFRKLRSVALKSAGTSSVKIFPWYTVVHLPVFLTATFAIRRLADNPPTAWASGGPGWCTDLAAADPMGILPVINTALFLWNAHGPKNQSTSRLESEENNDISTNASSGSGVGSSTAAGPTARPTSFFSGDSMSTFFQAIGIFAFPYMQNLPVGYFIFWISSGLMTATQRVALSSESFRRAIGLPSAEELAKARQGAGPPVLQAAGGAVKAVREQLEYVQRQVLSQFASRRVDDSLREDVNRALSRELERGNIRVSLEAVIRKDEESGKKYVAVIRRGSGGTP